MGASIGAENVGRMLFDEEIFKSGGGDVRVEQQADGRILREMRLLGMKSKIQNEVNMILNLLHLGCQFCKNFLPSESPKY